MYADYSRDQVNAFLSDLIEQPVADGLSDVAESFSDDMILAQMELARYKSCKTSGERFVPRDILLEGLPRVHPADRH